MKEEIKKSIALNLRNLRKSKLLNVVDVAKGISINKDTIYRLEQGKSNNLDVLIMLLDYYNEKPNIFFKKVYDNCHK